MREQDLNLRPSGYEPDELPGCSIPRPLERIALSGMSLTRRGWFEKPPVEGSASWAGCSIPRHEGFVIVERYIDVIY